MTDHLASLPARQVAAWYRRLADRIARERLGDEEPLAAILLRHWLENRDPASTLTINAPIYLKNSTYVATVLQYHRSVFLTERRARLDGGRERWVGVLPRIQGLAGFSRWDISRPLELEYESLVEVGAGLVDLIRIQRRGTAEERDLLTALRGFQLRSRVTVSAARQETGGRITIRFANWQARIRDRYDWDYSEHFTVPNPDFRSSRTEAVRPGDANLTVYHSNARRVEQAGLAAPFDIVSHEWGITDLALLAPGEVDPSRSL